MNLELIEELAQQCMVSTCVDGLEDVDKELDHYEFAEAIIRECIAIASIQEQEYRELKRTARGSETSEVYEEGAYVAEVIQAEIEDYFGL